MKKNLGLILILFLLNIANAQTKSTGSVALGSSMSVKLDMDSSTSTLTMTLTGPSTRWFAIGFHATNMATSSDCVVANSATTLKDYKPLGGHNTPSLDPVQDWTLVSNTTSGTSRTMVATRALSTGDTNDYTFNYATLNSLNIIWAFGQTTSYSFSGDHNNNRGAATLSFTTLLGTDNFATLYKLFVYPNPSNGIVNIHKNNAVEIKSIRLYNSSAQLVKEIDADFSLEVITFETGNLAKGLYFVEIANDNDKIVKKIEIN